MPEPDWRVVVKRPPEMTVVYDWPPEGEDVSDAELPRPFDESHEEQANELGRFTFSTFAVDDLDIEPGDLVAFYDRGQCIGGGVIRSQQTTKVGKAVEGGRQTIRHTGVRPFGVLEEGPVLPVRGLGSTALDRMWGWFAPGFDDSGPEWVNATVISTVASPPTVWVDAPMDDFGDQTANYIWAAGTVDYPDPDVNSAPGECLFRQTFTIPAGVPSIEIQGSGDDDIDLWFEGERALGSGQNWTNIGEGFQTVRLPVVPGEALIAVAASNFIDYWGTGVNPGAAVWAVWAVNEVGARGDLLAHSDSSVKVLEYPSSRPGVSAGHALLEVLEEDQAYGWCLGVTPTFTAELDSNGEEWAEIGEIGTKVGYSLWKLTQQLIAVYIDSDLDPDTHEWHAWSKGTRGTSTDVVLEESTIDPEAGNLQEHVVTETLMRGNDILSYSRYGWQLHRSGEGGRRIAATLGLGALPSTDAVNRYALAELEETSENRLEHDVKILPASDDDKPYWAFGIGDTITIDGSPEIVQQISWRRDRNGVIWWDEDEAPPPDLSEPT